MARITYFLTFVLSVCIFSNTTAQIEKNPGKSNLAYLYDLNAPILCDYEVAIGEEEATVFMKVTQRNNNTSVDKISYELHSNYEGQMPIREGALSESNLLKVDGNITYHRFEFPLNVESHYAFVYIQGTSTNGDFYFRYDISLNNAQSFPLTDLVFMEATEDIPLFGSAISKEKEFRIVSLYDQDSANAFLYYYNHNFPPNPPPMADSGSEVQKSLDIDSIFPVQLNKPLQFENEGLYFCQLDTTTLSGVSFRISSKYYPRYVTAEELIDPLRYISTSEEMDNMTDADDPKVALDRYWVKVTRSQDRAREVIKNYYRQVTNANSFFTNYKEGWKTGQGMVYMLFGPPDEVYKNGAEEKWMYTSQTNLMENISFNFIKVKNIFTNRHYNLQRDEDYRKFWYRNIDLWRKGRKQI